MTGCAPHGWRRNVGKADRIAVHRFWNFPLFRRRGLRRTVDRFHRMVPAASSHRQRQFGGAHGRFERHPGERRDDGRLRLLDGNMNVEQFVENYLLRSGKRCFVVQQNGEVAGLVTAHEIKELDRARWPYTTLSDIMRPLDQLHTVAPTTHGHGSARNHGPRRRESASGGQWQPPGRNHHAR